MVTDAPLLTRAAALAVLGALALTLAACTDTNLYSPTLPRKEADRLALRGRVCTEDPVEARFPVRVVLLVDQAAGPLYASFDPASRRIDVMRGFVQSALQNPETEIAVVGFAGRARKLAPEQGNFTRNPGELLNAINRISLAEPCLDEVCRDLHDGLRSTRTLIEGDLAALPAGLRVLTQYVVILVDAGPPDPLSFARDCCPPDDIECIDGGGNRSLNCDRRRALGAVDGMRQLVADSGAAGLRFHVVQLAAEPNVDGAEEQVNDQMEQVLTELAFSGAGVFRRFNAIGGFDANALDLLKIRTVLQARLFTVANLNALPGPDGPRVDTDADGLSDVEEGALGTSAGARDSDGDGITDLVEVLVGFDALTPDTPTACVNTRLNADQDLDGLTDCDEELLGSEPTLVDTDGDGLPDRLEVIGGTDHLNPDATDDTDGDGVSNGDEIRQRSDARSTDTRAHLNFGYRYDIEDEGFVRELFAGRLLQLTGVEVTTLSAGTTAGLGTLVWDPDTRTLRWKDAGDAQFGPPVTIADANGTYELPSSSWAPIQGDDGRRVTAEITAIDLPPRAVTENLRIIFRNRQCLTWTVRNVQLVPTGPLDDGSPRGGNSILLYLAQAPEDRLDAPGPFRLAQIPILFDPPRARQPDDAVLLIEDAEFIRPRISIDPLRRQSP